LFLAVVAALVAPVLVWAARRQLRRAATDRIGQPVVVSGIVLDGEEDGAGIVAALDDVQLLIGEEIAAEPGRRHNLA
jgi:hypothetical protein